MSDDAVHLLTDGLGPSEVIARIIALAVHRRPLLLDRLVEEQVKIGRSRQEGYVKVLGGNIVDPPGPWQLGLTNPSADRLPNRFPAWLATMVAVRPGCCAKAEPSGISWSR